MKSLRPQINLVCLLATVAFATRAVAVSPPPDGGYPFQNTAEGEDALLNLFVGSSNTAVGYHSLYSDTNGTGNTAMGSGALESYIGTSSTGSNTAIGANTLQSNTYGSGNTAVGVLAMEKNTSGDNTAVGAYALENSTSAIFNTAVGASALSNNSTGGYNVAVGNFALMGNSNGFENVGIGYSALSENNTGGKNIGIGSSALRNNTTASNNVAVGSYALEVGTTGGNNVAVGFQASHLATTGSGNVAVGMNALQTSTTGLNNIAIGMTALSNNTTGSGNIAIGLSAGRNISTGSNNIDIAALGAASDSNTIRIGRSGIHTGAFMQGIRGVTVAGGLAVIVGSDGHLGTTTSSARYKDQIEPMADASAVILSLKPVTFHYKKELDPEGIQQFGLIAEEVEKVNPDLVARDEKGKPYTVRYEAVNAMLLNEFLKEHRKVEALEHAQDMARADAAGQQREIDSLRATLKEQAAQIQKVNDRLAADETSPPMLVNTR